MSMAWVWICNTGEIVTDRRPFKDNNGNMALLGYNSKYVLLPKGSIKKLIGRELTFEDEPVELKEE